VKLFLRDPLVVECSHCGPVSSASVQVVLFDFASHPRQPEQLVLYQLPDRLIASRDPFNFFRGKREALVCVRHIEPQLIVIGIDVAKFEICDGMRISLASSDWSQSVARSTIILLSLRSGAGRFRLAPPLVFTSQFCAAHVQCHRPQNGFHLASAWRGAPILILISTAPAPRRSDPE